MEIINPPSSVTPPSQPDMSDTLNSAKKARRKRLLITGTILAVILVAGTAGFYDQFLQTRVGKDLRFRILGPTSTVVIGQEATITWDVSTANQEQYPNERIEYCTSKTDNATCKVTLKSSTPNNGIAQVIITDEISPGYGYFRLTALDTAGNPYIPYSSYYAVRVSAASQSNSGTTTSSTSGTIASSVPSVPPAPYDIAPPAPYDVLPPAPYDILPPNPYTLEDDPLPPTPYEVNNPLPPEPYTIITASVSPAVTTTILPSFLPITNAHIIPILGALFQAGAQIDVSFSYNMSAHDSIVCGQWYLNDKPVTGTDWVTGQLPDPSLPVCN